MKKVILTATLLFVAGYLWGQSQKVFYISFPYAIPAGTVIKVDATGRLDALTRTRVTVFTKEEFEGPCKLIIECKEPIKTVEELLHDTYPTRKETVR